VKYFIIIIVMGLVAAVKLDQLGAFENTCLVLYVCYHQEIIIAFCYLKMIKI